MSILQDIKDSFREPNNTLKQIILINVIVFVVLLVVITPLSWTGYDYNIVENAIVEYLALPSSLNVLIFKPWTIISYYFTHVGFLHILFNMLNLYWFGQLVFEYLGDKRLLSLYILGGVAGGVLYILMYNLIPAFSQQESILIGASASVLAVVVAAATLLPNYTFNLLLFGPIKIKYIAAALVLMSWALAKYSVVGNNAGGNIAHLGGAFIGWIFIKQLQSGTDIGRPIHAIIAFFIGLFSRKPKLKVSHRRASSTGVSTNRQARKQPGKPDQNEIDRILDKISSSGYESLSKEEKQMLFQASQKE